MSDSKDLQSYIKVSKINLTSFALKNQEEFEKYTEDDRKFIFKIQVGVATNQPNKLVEVISKIEVCLDMTKMISLAEIQTSCRYQIDNFDELIKISENEYTMDGDLQWSLVSASLSSTRGIFAIKVSGTFLGILNLPFTERSEFESLAKETGRILPEIK